ncbi:MAG: glutamyl-tRNA reductase [Endomicrobia bacterium]|nr:glutamyl-tRNA reductase [Endomicrobiia bacterium]
MNFAVFGINHKSACFDIREKYAFSKSKQLEILNRIKNENLICGGVLVVTCNRTEIYVDYLCEEYLKETVFTILDISKNDMDKFYFLKGISAFEHLVSVLCGIDSQIIGETEIVNQVKSAYELARNVKSISKNINILFQKGLQISKKVRTETKIQQGNLSYGSIILETIEDFFKKDEVLEVLIVGTGKMAEVVAKYLSKERFKVTFMSTKHYDKAVVLAKVFDAEVLGFDMLKEKVNSSDVVITATLSPHCIIKKQMLTVNKPKLIFDLAIPRNVERCLSDLDFVKLYTIDDLDIIRNQVYQERLKKLNYARQMIKVEVEKLWQKFSIEEQMVSLDLAVDQAS